MVVHVARGYNFAVIYPAQSVVILLRTSLYCFLLYLIFYMCPGQAYCPMRYTPSLLTKSIGLLSSASIFVF